MTDTNQNTGETSSKDVYEQLDPNNAEWKKVSDSIGNLSRILSDYLKMSEQAMEDYLDSLNRKKREIEKKEKFLKQKEEDLDRQYKDASDSEKKQNEAKIRSYQDLITEKDKAYEQLARETSRQMVLLQKVEGLSSYMKDKFSIESTSPDLIVKKIIAHIDEKELEYQKLQEDLLRLPSKEDHDKIKEELDHVQHDLEVLENRNKELESGIKKHIETTSQVANLKLEKQVLESRCAALELANKKQGDELKKLQNIYQSAAERDARIESIEKPYITRFNTTQPIRSKVKDELLWLQNILEQCKNHGITFLERILYSFHTSLKIAEWSPITVLAGVSGTGKSELPRLYSHFGGINFLNLSVQSNWDSQESMLGYFNTIENFYDAQPVLRLLAQSQKKWSDEYPGLKDYMTLVLMDEMNLAHVELYFAEFLSKLEQRRGCSDANVPILDVKLGANITPYDLPLGRNVLWAGTMNQDETTKSLSDKVLDRSVVINFPRPTTLISRTHLSALPDNNELLPLETWMIWQKNAKPISDDIIKSYKSDIEKINKYLGVAGRGLGHRVWQSIENYMMNYPTVIAIANDKNSKKEDYKRALDIAFEDQLVQKVMPKLRGIETSGNVAELCLGKIQLLLKEKYPTLNKDFEQAMNSGYGQFMWNSALYLTNDSDES